MASGRVTTFATGACQMDEKQELTEPYYIEEDVIGSTHMYHRPSCRVIQSIYKHNRKRLQNWQVAVGLGLAPCGVCKPFFAKPDLKPPRKIGFRSI
jgi:hypothetical protein